jgi:amino acid adenylation domain-containing protein
VDDASSKISLHLIDSAHPPFSYQPIPLQQGGNKVSIAKAKINTFDRRLKDQRDFWMQKLKGKAGKGILSPDFQRPVISSREKASVEVNFHNEILSRLAKLTGNSPFLNYATLVTAMKICLYRYSGDSSIVVGSPCLRDGEPGLSNNAVTIVDEIDGRMTFQTLLTRVRETLEDAYDRQTYPFSKILAELGLEEEKSRCALFDVALSYEDLHAELADVGTDILATFSASGHKLTGRLEYRKDLYRKASIERLRDHFLNVLREGLEDFNRPIGELQMLTEEERRRLLVDWNDTYVVRPRGQSFQQLFEEQAKNTPGAVAVDHEGLHLTYDGLNRRSNQLAHHLRKLGVGPETIVAICQERSAELMIGLLAVIKAGGAFVPLDPSYPKERIEFMLEDSGAALLITHSQVLGNLPKWEKELICLDAEWRTIDREQEHDPEIVTTPANLAYAIYTSGSTGTPKGSLITHQSLTNYVLDVISRFGLQSTDRILQFAPFSFDVAIEEIFPTWLSGAAVVLRDAMSLASTSEFSAVIEEAGVTACELPATYWNEWVFELGRTNIGPPASLRLIIIGCELPLPERLEYWQRFRVPLLNVYGLTETTITSTIFSGGGSRERRGQSPLPIGRPINNTQIYILDTNLLPVPLGVSGEIYIAGAGLARGYLNRPDITAERFIINPFAREEGERMYKTGDLGVYLPDGNIEFLGRVDYQAKIRGFRVEPGEIENVIKQCPTVQNAIVVVREDGGRHRDFGQESRTWNQSHDPEEVVKQLVALDPEAVESLFAEVENLHEDETGWVLAMEMQSATGKHNTKVRRYKDFDLTLNIYNDEFITPPRISQRNWMLRRALDEFADDLTHLDEIAKTMVPGSARPRLNQEWSGSEAYYDGSQLIIQGQQVMQDWESPLMRAMAKVVTESHGDVLELGFGMGISATHIQEFGVRSYTVVEANDKVAEYFEKWKTNYPGRDINLIHGRWHDVADRLGTYDGIFFDTVPNFEEEYMREVIDNVVMAEDIFPLASRCLRDGGVFTWYTNEVDSFSRRHQRLVLKYFSSFSLSVVRSLRPPEDCHYWQSDSMVVVKAVK